LAELILDGGVAPGQLVTIQGLAEAFGVSTMPVREAMKRLTAANALTVVSGRTIGVAPLTLERLEDLRNVRVEVEGLATAWAAAKADKAIVSKLRGHLDNMEKAISISEARPYLQANRAFHFEIYRSAGSRTLIGIIENLWLQIGPYLSLLRESGNYETANLRHAAIVEAMESHDAAAAREEVAGDIDDAYRMLTKILE